jgi:hypothetical protein
MEMRAVNRIVEIVTFLMRANVGSRVIARSLPVLSFS